MDNTPFFACIASGIVYNKDINEEKQGLKWLYYYTQHYHLLPFSHIAQQLLIIKCSKRNLVNSKKMINTKVHIDMDGVIADFFSALAEFRKVNHWKDQGEITLDTSIKELRGTNFFETLPVFPFAKKLVDLVKSYTGGEYYINTSPLRDDMENSRKYKTKWLQKHNFVPNDIIVTKRKESYAVDKQTGLPNILIDDRPKNLEKWIAKGGFGIRYQANEDSIKIVEKGLKLYARTVAELKGKNTESKVTQVDKKSMPKENELG